MGLTKQPGRRFISLRTTILAVCALPHLEMAVPVTELTPQFSYFESERAHTSILRSIRRLKIKWEQQVKEMIYGVVVAVLAIFGPKAGKTETPNDAIYMHFRGLKALRHYIKRELRQNAPCQGER